MMFHHLEIGSWFENGFFKEGHAFKTFLDKSPERLREHRGRPSRKQFRPI